MEAARVACAAILQERAGLHPESCRQRTDPYPLRGREAPRRLKSIPLGEGCRPLFPFFLRRPRAANFVTSATTWVCVGFVFNAIDQRSHEFRGVELRDEFSELLHPDGAA